MKVSRQMVIGYLELLLGVFAIPQFVALIPATSLPYVACVGGFATVLLRALNGALGVNLLSVAGILALAAGLMSMPELLPVIPVSAMPVITGLAGVLTVIARYVAGRVIGDPASAVNALVRVP